MLIKLDDVMFETMVHTGAQRRFVSKTIVNKYFKYKKPQVVDVNVFAVSSLECNVNGAVQFKVEVV